jgi:hypothetical protein
MSKLQEIVKERRQDAEEAERKAERALQLEHEIADLRRDLDRFQKRYDAFAALGEGHLEVEQKSPYAGLGVIEWEPLRSKLNGRELAAGVQFNIDSLKEQIDAREQEIKQLLA